MSTINEAWVNFKNSFPSIFKQKDCNHHWEARLVVNRNVTVGMTYSVEQCSKCPAVKVMKNYLDGRTLTSIV